jgi:hypothetical protein
MGPRWPIIHPNAAFADALISRIGETHDLTSVAAIKTMTDPSTFGPAGSADRCAPQLWSLQPRGEN